MALFAVFLAPRQLPSTYTFRRLFSYDTHAYGSLYYLLHGFLISQGAGLIQKWCSRSGVDGLLPASMWRPMTGR
ncbi:MAG: hypothetical protein R2932_30715 [Caldilineaceae bacterium]